MKLFKGICFFVSMFLFYSHAFAHEANITITGSDTPVNGSCYTAAGGHEPYTWSISKGSINSNGCVSNITGKCGAATVTAMDSCGETAVKNVRMPGGTWIFVSDVYHCGVISGCGLYLNCFKHVYSGITLETRYNWCSSTIGYCGNHGCSQGYCNNVSIENECYSAGGIMLHYRTRSFIWRCP